MHGTVPSGTWLDVGCGSGELAAELAAVAAPERMVGVDPEPWERWRVLTTRDPTLELLPVGCEVLVETMGAGRVDVVVCNQVYEHVPDPGRLLSAIHDVMKPGALCYFAGPNLLWPIEPHVFWPFVHWLPRRFAQSAMRFLGSRQAAGLDAWSLDWWRLHRLFASARLEPETALHQRLAAVAGPSPTARAARALATLPSVFFRAGAPFAPGHVFVLRKAP